MVEGSGSRVWMMTRGEGGGAGGRVHHGVHIRQHVTSILRVT